MTTPIVLDPGHEPRRARMHRIGLVLAIGGAVAIGLGLVVMISGALIPTSTFFEDPHGTMDAQTSRAAIGFILITLGSTAIVPGLALLFFSNAGRIARFGAAETVPVTKDVVRDLSPVAAEVARDLASAVKQGLSDAPAGDVRHACGATNAAASKFCKGCGQSLALAACGSCGAKNDPDAKFCAGCGHALSAVA